MQADAAHFERAAPVTDSSIMNAEIKLPLFFIWFVVRCDSSLLIIITKHISVAGGRQCRPPRDARAESTAGHTREPAVAASA